MCSHWSNDICYISKGSCRFTFWYSRDYLYDIICVKVCIVCDFFFFFVFSFLSNIFCVYLGTGIEVFRRYVECWVLWGCLGRVYQEQFYNCLDRRPSVHFSIFVVGAFCLLMFFLSRSQIFHFSWHVVEFLNVSCLEKKFSTSNLLWCAVFRRFI